MLLITFASSFQIFFLHRAPGENFLPCSIVILCCWLSLRAFNKMEKKETLVMRCFHDKTWREIKVPVFLGNGRNFGTQVTAHPPQLIHTSHFVIVELSFSLCFYYKTLAPRVHDLMKEVELTSPPMEEKFRIQDIENTKPLEEGPFVQNSSNKFEVCFWNCLALSYTGVVSCIQGFINNINI